MAIHDTSLMRSAAGQADVSDQWQRPATPSPWKPITFTWAQRFGHLAAESAHRTASAAWALGDATLGKDNPQFSQNAQTARAYHASEAARHLQQARAHGAVLHPNQLKERGDASNYLLSSISRGVVPVGLVIAGARTYGLPGAAASLYALNLAYKVEDQFDVAGQADLKEAAVAAATTTAIQLRVGTALPGARWLERPLLGALGAIGTGLGHSLNLAHLPADRKPGVSWWQRVADGALMATALAPLSWVSQGRALMSASTPQLTHTRNRPSSTKPLPGPTPSKPGALARPTYTQKRLPADVSAATPVVTSRTPKPHPPWASDSNQISVLGFAPFRTYQMPQPYDDMRMANAPPDTGDAARPVNKIWVRGRASSAEHNASNHFNKHNAAFAQSFQNFYEYADAAYALTKMPMSPDIRRLHTYSGTTMTVDLKNHHVAVNDPAGRVITMHPTIRADTLDALDYWRYKSHVNPPVAVRKHADYTMAMTALGVQQAIWQAAGLPQDQIAQYLLKIRETIEDGMAHLPNVRPSSLRTHADAWAEAKLKTRYTALKQLGYTERQIIDVALDTTGKYYPQHNADGHYTARPPIRWATTDHHPSAEQHLAAQWIEHRYDLPEFKTIYEFLDAAHRLAQTSNGPGIEHQTLSQGTRLTLDHARQLALLEVDGAPYAFFRPLNTQTFGSRIAAIPQLQSTRYVTHYANALSALKTQADRQYIALGPETASVVDTIAQLRSSADMGDMRGAYPASYIQAILSRMPLPAKSDTAGVNQLYPSQLEVLDLMLQGVPTRSIVQQVGKSPVVVSNLTGKIYAHLNTLRNGRGLGIFDDTHEGGLTQLYLDTKAAQNFKAQNPSRRILKDLPFDQTRLIGLTEQQFEMLKHLLGGTMDHPSLAAAMRLPEKRSRAIKAELFTKLNIANTEQLSSYPGGLARLKRDVTHIDAIERQRDPLLKALLSTRFELLYNYWTFGIDARTTATMTGGRANRYAQYLDELKDQFSIQSPGHLTQFGGDHDQFSQALHIEKQARHVGYATVAQLLDQPYLKQRAMAGIEVVGPFRKASDVKRLIHQWGGHIKVDRQDNRTFLYWQPEVSAHSE